jgi:hypothetical protein
VRLQLNSIASTANAENENKDMQQQKETLDKFIVNR